MKSPSIQKVTERGQITLPISWRRDNVGRFISVKEYDGGLLIKPVNEKEDTSEYTVFDALRDNGGKGIKAKDLVKYLKK